MATGVVDGVAALMHVDRILIGGAPYLRDEGGVVAANVLCDCLIGLILEPIGCRWQ